MGNSNIWFLEEYKRLDKLLCDMYQSEKGVTSYIDNMKNTAPYKSRYIPGWDEDLQQLIAIRNLRNQLVHDCGMLERKMCTQNDIEWINTFHSRILQRMDPIAILAKQANSIRQKNSAAKQIHNDSIRMNSEKNNCEYEALMGKTLVGLTLVAVVLVVVWIVYTILQ